MSFFTCRPKLNPDISTVRGFVTSDHKNCFPFFHVFSILKPYWFSLLSSFDVCHMALWLIQNTVKSLNNGNTNSVELNTKKTRILFHVAQVGRSGNLLGRKITLFDCFVGHLETIIRDIMNMWLHSILLLTCPHIVVQLITGH